MRRRCRRLLAAVAVAALCGGAARAQPAADLLLAGGLVHDGSGQPPRRQDIGVTGDRISFVGDAAAAGLDAAVVVDVGGLMVTPGFIDMHSHAELAEDYGRDALPFLHQGITTVASGLDGGGTPDVADLFARLQGRIGVNAFTYAGHGTIPEAGNRRRRPRPHAGRARRDARAGPAGHERKGVRHSRPGSSTCRANTPPPRRSSSWRGSRPSSTASTTPTTATSGPPTGGSGLPQLHPRGDPDRRRGGAAGHLQPLQRPGRAQLRPRFRGGPPHRGGACAGRGGRGGAARLHRDPVEPRRPTRYRGGPRTAAAARCSNGSATPRPSAASTSKTMEMLAIRGGAGKLLFADPRPELNGRTLAAVADEWGLPVPATVRRILADGNAAVMNLDLYDIENTRYLARQPWMMTCTDGRTPSPAQNVTHPRVFGAFTRKLRQFVLDEQVLTMPFAVRSMTGPRRRLPAPRRPRLPAGGCRRRHRRVRPRPHPRPRHLRRPAAAVRGHGARARQRPLRDTRRRADRRP